MNSNTLIWDLPTRICHWLFALSLTVSLGIALTVDDENPLFRYHMLFGFVAGAVLVVRVVLGFVGSKPSRFTSFPLNPVTLVSYFKGVLTRRREPEGYGGNNPGSALAALGMFLLVPALLASGLLGGGETVEELHGVFAYALLGVIVVHLIGIAIHTLSRRENIALAMITGRKEAPVVSGLSSSRLLAGLAVFAVITVWSGALFRSYDAQVGTVRLPLVGTTLQLGEGEEEGKHSEAGEGRGKRGEEEDDD